MPPIPERRSVVRTKVAEHHRKASGGMPDPAAASLTADAVEEAKEDQNNLFRYARHGRYDEVSATSILLTCLFLAVKR